MPSTEAEVSQKCSDSWARETLRAAPLLLDVYWRRRSHGNRTVRSSGPHTHTHTHTCTLPLIAHMFGSTAVFHQTSVFWQKLFKWCESSVLMLQNDMMSLFLSPGRRRKMSERRGQKSVLLSLLVSCCFFSPIFLILISLLSVLRQFSSSLQFKNRTLKDIQHKIININLLNLLKQHQAMD